MLFRVNSDTDFNQNTYNSLISINEIHTLPKVLLRNDEFLVFCCTTEHVGQEFFIPILDNFNKCFYLYQHKNYTPRYKIGTSRTQLDFEKIKFKLEIASIVNTGGETPMMVIGM